MSQGSQTGWRVGAPASANPLTLRPEDTIITRSADPWHRGSDIAAHSGPATTSGDGAHSSGIFGGTPPSHSSPFPDNILDNSEGFNDTPYMPPRATQAELDTFSALDPRRSNNVYDQPNHVLHPQYPYEGGTSPAESHHSVDSNWSASSSSSTCSQRVPSEYLADSSSGSHYTPNQPLPVPPTHSQHYPAYQGQSRLGFEHIRYGDQPSNTGGSYYRTQSSGYSLETVDDPSRRVDISSQASYSSQGDPSPSAISLTSQSTHISTFSVSPAAPTDDSQLRFPDAGPYLRQQLGLAPHEPVSLQCLPDPPVGEKPSTPLPMLIKLAIYGSPNKQLTLQDIYTELENRFQWFRDHKNERAWKNSIRHNLSLNKVFQHVPRPITEPGKGSYWQLDVSGGEGYKRTRKRRPKSKLIASEEEEEDVSEMEDDRRSPLDSAGLSRPSSALVEDLNIDPGLRGEGHVVGEGRTRSATRRTGDGSPYPSQSPRYQQGPLPVADPGSSAQSLARFGQPSFGQTSFPAHPQTAPIPMVATTTTTSASFAALSSSTAMTPAPPMVVRPHLQPMTAYDRTVQIPQPQPPPRAGIEYVMDPGGLPAARRVKAYPEGRVPAPGGGGAAGGAPAVRSSPEALPSGSSRAWNDAQLCSDMQDLIHDQR